MCFMPWHKLPSMAISQKNLCCLLFVTLVNYFKSHECKSWILFICVSLWNGESLETKKGSHVFFLALSIFYGFIMKHLLMLFQSSNMYCIKPIFYSFVLVFNSELVSQLINKRTRKAVRCCFLWHNLNQLLIALTHCGTVWTNESASHCSTWTQRL